MDCSGRQPARLPTLQTPTFAPMECIILAGGLGTRLHSVTQDLLPKCMAPVNGKPFLYYLFQYLATQKPERVLLALGHRAAAVMEWSEKQDVSFEIEYILEKEPLGTGGAMQSALKKTTKEHIAVLNGDTFFPCNLHELYQFHIEKNAAATLALKQMYGYDRYGSVVMDEQKRILQFEEKQYTPQGFINAGVYIICKNAFMNKALPEKFSFEQDYLEAFVGEGNFYGKDAAHYFIDIGIPEDYQKAQEDFITLFA